VSKGKFQIRTLIALPILLTCSTNLLVLCQPNRDHQVDTVRVSPNNSVDVTVGSVTFFPSHLSLARLRAKFQRSARRAPSSLCSLLSEI
jgi:hypothetical protein